MKYLLELENLKDASDRQPDYKFFITAGTHSSAPDPDIPEAHLGIGKGFIFRVHSY